MADTPKFTKLRVTEGMRFDTIAQLAYGNAEDVVDLILDNRHLASTGPLPAGAIIYVRIKENTETGELLPPWFGDEEEEVAPPEVGGGGIGVVEGPLIPLGFSQGYPRVVANKIEFAINKTKRYPYSVYKKNSGAIIAESPGYDFTAGFPVITSLISEGDIYKVKVGDLISGDLTVIGSGSALAFLVLPYYQQIINQNQIRFTINKTGSYVVKLIRISDSVTVSSTTESFTAGVEFIKNITDTANYRVEVGSIFANVNTVVEESTEQPLYITKAGFSYDYQSLDFSLYLQTTEDVEVSVVRADALPTTGLSYELIPWSSAQYIPGTSAYAIYIPPFTEAFPFNPLTYAAGGLANLTDVVFRVRRVSDRTKVFKFDFTTPGYNIPFFQEIELTADEEDLPACELGPFIASEVTYFNVGATWFIQFLLNANAVYALKWRVKNNLGTVVDSGVQPMVDESLAALFYPSNIPKIAVDELDNGSYTLEIRGHTCSSPDWGTPMPFTVDIEEEEPEPPVVTGPVTPKLEQFGLKQHCDIQISGSSEDWTLNDYAAEQPGAGNENVYDINDVRIRGSQLRNYKFESNRSLLVVRYMYPIGQAEFWAENFQHFSRNTTAGFCMFTFNEFVES